jgi:hypothetical protein
MQICVDPHCQSPDKIAIEVDGAFVNSIGSYGAVVTLNLSASDRTVCWEPANQWSDRFEATSLKKLGVEGTGQFALLELVRLWRRQGRRKILPRSWTQLRSNN